MTTNKTNHELREAFDKKYKREQTTKPFNK